MHSLMYYAEAGQPEQPLPFVLVHWHPDHADFLAGEKGHKWESPRKELLFADAHSQKDGHHSKTHSKG